MTLPDLINNLKTAPYHLIDICLYSSVFTIISLFIGLIIIGVKHKNPPKFLISLIIISTITLLSIATYIAINKDYNSYTISRDNTHLYVNSHTDYLKSAKLKIINTDEYFIYAKYKKNTYKIPSISLKEKN